MSSLVVFLFVFISAVYAYSKCDEITVKGNEIVPEYPYCYECLPKSSPHGTCKALNTKYNPSTLTLVSTHVKLSKVNCKDDEQPIFCKVNNKQPHETEQAIANEIGLVSKKQFRHNLIHSQKKKPVAVLKSDHDSKTGFTNSAIIYDARDSKGAVAYSWDFGDGTSTTQSGGRAEHIFAKKGTFTVTVTVKAANGQIATASMQQESLVLHCVQLTTQTENECVTCNYKTT